MANKNIFKPAKGRNNVKAADTLNEAGGKAYNMDPKEALAQMVSTGTISNTFYASSGEQLEMIKDLASKCSSKFLLKLAYCARHAAWMKDTPALLLAIIAGRKDYPENYDEVFIKTLDNGRMIRNFVQMILSGQLGRTNMGSRPKRLLKVWFKLRDDDRLLNDSVGNDPSIRDIINLSHPAPRDKQQEALFKYLLGKEYNYDNLPHRVKVLEEWRKGKKDKDPSGIEFRMLTDLNLTLPDWKRIIKGMGPHALRINLRNLHEKGVFGDEEIVDFVAEKLRNEEAIQRSRTMPYQLFSAYKFGGELPRKIVNALHDSVDISMANVPNLGKTLICLDISSSMTSPVTGQGNQSKISCMDVAALMAAMIVKKSDGKVIEFNGEARLVNGLEPRDTTFSIAKQLARPSGGTNCSSAMRLAISEHIKADTVIFLSDNQSWADFHNRGLRVGWSSGTGLAEEWKNYKNKVNKNAKIVLIDLQPYSTTQMPTDNDVLNVGGFNDSVMDVIANFIAHKKNWVESIENVQLV